jgi:uncharacterized protein YjbK
MVLPDSLPPVQSRDMVPPRPAAAASDRGLNASGARARASSLLLAAAGAHGLHFVAGSSAVAAIASSDLRESHRPYVTGDWQRDDASGAVTLKIEINVPRAAAWAFAPASPRSLPPSESTGANVSSDLIGFSRSEQSSPPMAASQSTTADASAHSTSNDTSSESISARGPRTRPPARDSTSNGATLIAHGVLTVIDRLISQRHADWLRDSSAAPEVELRFVCADPDFDGAQLRTTELFRLASRYCDCFGKALQQSCVALRACFANGGASVSAPQHVTVLVDALPPTVSKFLAGTVVDDIIRSAGIDRASCTARIANRHDETRPFLLDRHAHLVREHARRALMTSEFDERERLEAAAMQELILTGSHYRTMIDHVLVERRTQDDEIEASAFIAKSASVSVSQSMFVDGVDEPTARLLRQERTARARLQATLLTVDDVDSPSVHHCRIRGGAESWYGRIGGLYGFMLAHARATSELIRLEDSARTAMNGFAGIHIQRMNLVAREEIARPHVERRLMQEFTTAVADSVVGFLVPGWYAVALRHNTFLARLCVDITRYTDHVVAYMTQLQIVFLELCESGRVRLGLLHAANAAWHTCQRLITALLDMVTHDEPAARQLAQCEESAARGLLEARFALTVACPIAEAKARKDLNQRQATWFRDTTATFALRLEETSARSVVAFHEQTARHLTRCHSDEAMARRYIQRDASFVFIGTPHSGGKPVHIDHLHQMHTAVCAALRSHGLWQQAASEAMNTLRRRVHDRCHLLVDEAASRKVVADGCASSRFVASAIFAKTCAKRSLELEICEIAFRARTSQAGTQEVSLLRRCAASVRAILEAENQERAVLATAASHSRGAVSNAERNRSFVRDAAQAHMHRQSIHLCEHTETVTRAAFSGSLLLELHQWHRISRTIAEEIVTRAGLERVAFTALNVTGITAAQAHARLRLELRAFRKHNNHAVCAMSEVNVIHDYAAAVGTTLVEEASARSALHRAFTHARSVAEATETSGLFCAQALMAVTHRETLLYAEHSEFVERIRAAACAMLRVDHWRCVSVISLCEYQARASLAAQAVARALVLVSESEALWRRQLASHAFVDLQAVVCSSYRAAVEIREIGDRAQIVAAAQFMVHQILRCLFTEDANRVQISQAEEAERHTMLDNYQQRRRNSVEDAEAGSRSQINLDARVALDRDVVLPCQEEAARIVIRTKQLSARRSLRRIEQFARLTATESEVRRLLVDELRTNTAILFHALSEEAALSALEGRTRQFIIVHADNVASMLRDAARTRRVLVTAEACERATLRTTASFVAHAIQRLAHSQDLMLTELAELLKRAAISMVSFSQLRHYFQTSAFILSESRARAEITQTEADERHAMLDNYQQRQRISVEDAEAGSRSQIDVDARSALDRDVVLPCHEEAARIVIRTKQMSARRSLRRIEQVARLTATESEARRLLVDELRTDTAILFHALSEEAALSALEGRTRQFIIVHADNVASMLRDAVRTRRVLVTAEACERATLRTTASFVAHAIQRLAHSQDLMLTELAELLKRAAISMVSFSQLRHYFQTSAFILSESRARAEITQTEADERHAMLDNYQQRQRISVEDAEAGSRSQIDVDARSALDRDVVLPCHEEAARIVIRAKQMSARRSLRCIEQVARLTATESEARRLLLDELRTNTAILFHALSEEAALCAREERTRQFIIVHADKVMSMLRDAARTRRVLVTAEASDRAALRTTATFVAHAIQRLSQSQDLMLTELAELRKRAAISMVSFSQLRHYFQTSAFILSESRARAEITQTEADERLTMLDNYQQHRRIGVEGAEAGSRCQIDVDARVALDRDVVLPCQQEAARIVIHTKQMSARRSLRRIEQVARLMATESEARRLLVDELRTDTAILFHALSEEAALCAREERTRQFIAVHADKVMSMLRDAARTRRVLVTAEASDRAALRTTASFVAHAIQRLSQSQDLMLTELAELLRRAAISMVSFSQLRHYFQTSAFILSESGAREQIASDLHIHTVNVLDSAERSARCALIAETEAAHNMVYQRAECSAASVEEALQRKWASQHATFTLHYAIPLEFAEGAKRIELACDCVAQRNAILAQRQVAWIQQDEAQSRLSLTAEFTDSISTLTARLNARLRVVSTEERHRHALIREASDVIALHGAVALRRLDMLLAEAAERSVLSRHHACIAQLLEARSFAQRSLMLQHVETIKRARLAMKASGTLLDLLNVSRVVQNEHTSRLAVEHRAGSFHFERFQQAEELARAVLVEGAVQNHRGLAQQCQRAELQLRETLQRRQLTTAAVLIAAQVMTVESDEAILRLQFAASQAKERELLASSLRFTRLFADESELRFAVVLQEQAAATSLFHTLETEKNITTSENAQRRALIFVAYEAGDVLREMTLARLRSLISEQRERMELRATFAFVTHSVMTSASHCELFLAEHADVVLRSTIAVRALAQVSLWHALTTTAVNEAAARATAQAERVAQAMRTLVLIESSARHGIVAEATQSSATIMDAARFQTVSLREQQRRSLVVMAAHVRLGGVIPLQFAEGSQRISIREDEASQRASFVAAHRAARLAAQETQGRLSISLRQQTSATTLFNLLTGETTVVIDESRERQVMEAAAAQVGEFTGLWIRDRVTVLASEASSRRSLQCTRHRKPSPGH